MQGFNYRTVHRPAEKRCNTNELSRRPNEKLKSEASEQEELRCQIPDFQTMEKAIGGAQEDLTSGSSSEKKIADVKAHARKHILYPPRGVAYKGTVNPMGLSTSLVFRVSSDMRFKSSPMTEVVVINSHLRLTGVSVNRVG